jgi:hypothetical protein
MEYKGFGRAPGAALILFAYLTQMTRAQDALRGTMTTALGDIAAIKQKAEAGDPRSQVLLGEALMSHFRSLDALGWYRKAATQKNVDGAYHTGHLLLYGRVGIPKDQIVQANASEGIHWTLLAATNLYPDALRDMSQAYQKGLGVGTNLLQAYAWQQLYAETSPGSTIGKVELNQMALTLDTRTIREAQELAAKFKQGIWQLPPIQKVPGDTNLTLNGLVGGNSPLAIINGKTFAVGESQVLTRGQQGPFTVKCIKIDTNSVLISVEGEDEPRRLTMK